MAAPRRAQSPLQTRVGNPPPPMNCLQSIVNQVGLCVSYACCMRPCFHDFSHAHNLDELATWKELIEGSPEKGLKGVKHYRHKYDSDAFRAEVAAAMARPEYHPALSTRLGQRVRLRRYKETHGFKTGDVIGYNCYEAEHCVRDVLRSVARVSTGAMITHVGMVYVHKYSDASMGDANGEGVFVVEADCSTNTFKTIEAVTGGLFTRKGMWVFDLEERISSAAAECYHLRLKTPLAEEKLKAMEEFMRHSYVRDPPFDYQSIFDAGFDNLDHRYHNDEHEVAAQEDNFDQFFCSEFVSGSLKKAGLFTLNATEQAPANVWDFNDILKAEYPDGLWEMPVDGEGKTSKVHAQIKFSGEYSNIRSGACLTCSSNACSVVCPCLCPQRAKDESYNQYVHPEEINFYDDARPTGTRGSLHRPVVNQPRGTYTCAMCSQPVEVRFRAMHDEAHASDPARQRLATSANAGR